MIDFKKIRQNPTWGTILREIAGNAIQLFLILYGLKCLLTLHGRMLVSVKGEIYYRIHLMPVTGLASVFIGLSYICWGLFLDMLGSSSSLERRTWRYWLGKAVVFFGCALLGIAFWHKAELLRQNSSKTFFDFLPVIRTQEDARAYFLMVLAFIFIFGIITLHLFLFAMFYREQVKKDLGKRVCLPIHIRWRPTLWYWSGYSYRYYYSTRFRVIYSDPNDFVHEAFCLVCLPLMENPFWGSYRVVWLSDAITGRLPPPEVWASDEIIRPKLEKWDESAEANNLLENPDKPPE